MLKSTFTYIIYLVMSVVVILFAQYTHIVAASAIKYYVYVDSALEIFFTHSHTALKLRHITALFISPLILTGIPALTYHAIKHKSLPYFIEITWFVWVVIALSNIL